MFYIDIAPKWAPQILLLLYLKRCLKKSVEFAALILPKINVCSSRNKTSIYKNTISASEFELCRMTYRSSRTCLFCVAECSGILTYC